VLVLVMMGTGCGLDRSRANATTHGPGAPQIPARLCPATDTSGVVQRVNDVRRRAGLRSLASDPRLAHIATERSAAMAAVRRLSHSGWERALRGSGLRDDQLGENVAYNFANPDTVMDGWMQSAGHRANILRPSFTRIGVGCVIDERGHRWWTQDFAG
jgi:uncharacterized protein YkwD